jgi:hypothetical protein
VGVSPAEDTLEFLELKRLQRFPGQGFQDRIPIGLSVIHDGPPVRWRDIWQIDVPENSSEINTAAGAVD